MSVQTAASPSEAIFEAPEPRAPVGGATVAEPAPTLTWAPVPSATSYRLQVAPEADFSAFHFNALVGEVTEITLYDAVPTNGATCYWRVRAITPDEPTPWSGVAHFTVQPEVETAAPATAPAGSTSGPAAPIPQRPVDGAPVDGQSAVFAWDAVPQAQGYEVQVAPTEDFASPRVGLSLDRTTSLTLYGMLPTDEQPFFWRLRARLHGGSFTPWSDPARLTATTDDAVEAFEAEQERRAAAEAERQEAMERARATERAEAESPVRTAQTSGAFVLGMATLTILSFIATLLLIAQAV